MDANSRRAYWKWYTERWNPDEVVKAVEEVIKDGGRLHPVIHGIAKVI